ncbi:protein of unknown function [Paraburkholderia dioscoreae]|uniref:Uncharacterized protein n=1 Tax=Paraburkholderia dioscoreae TaxID=2604047 RepID=A0A5Q4Z614_9BURK|nr:protein of unknown function [Paraburkholderia dioscoreae]
MPLGLDLHRSKLILAITLASIIAIDFITLPAPKSILIKAVPNIYVSPPKKPLSVLKPHRDMSAADA